MGQESRECCRTGQAPSTMIAHQGRRSLRRQEKSGQKKAEGGLRHENNLIKINLQTSRRNSSGIFFSFLFFHQSYPPKLDNT